MNVYKLKKSLGKRQGSVCWVIVLVITLETNDSSIALKCRQNLLKWVCVNVSQMVNHKYLSLLYPSLGRQEPLKRGG